MKKNHVIGGVIIFGLGLFLAYFYSSYIVEVLKGALQPILILFGLLAFAAGIFGRNTFKKMNFIVAAAFLFLGIYGLYDEYYAVVDFFNGLIPPLLIVLGLVSVVHGIRTLT